VDDDRGAFYFHEKIGGHGQGAVHSTSTRRSAGTGKA
jgi:hypothetical protein